MTNTDTEAPIPCDVDTFLRGVAAISEQLLRATLTGFDYADADRRHEFAVKLGGAALEAWRTAGAAIDLGAHCHD